MRLPVTGGCGFIGSNFIRSVLEHYQPEFVTNVDALTDAGNPENPAGFAEKYAGRDGIRETIPWCLDNRASWEPLHRR
jgi:dTDP-glucose 4,6-dehydratase